MQTYREYAASKGLAIAGARGRLSKAAKEAIAAAEAEGMTFKETRAKASAKAMAPDVTEDKPAQKVTQNDFGPTPDPYWPNAFHAWVDGKKIAVSGRVACGVCKCSLMYHHCSKPTALVKGSTNLTEVFYG